MMIDLVCDFILLVTVNMVVEIIKCVQILRRFLGNFMILIWYAIPLPDLKVLRFLGSISYELYLVHGVVIVVAYPLLSYGFGVFAVVVLSVSLLIAMSLNRLTKVMVRP